MPRVKDDPETKEMMRGIGARLWALRMAHEDMTEEKFAARIGVKQPSFHKWQAGMQFPNPVAMKKLCIRYNVDFNYIYLGSFSGLAGDLAVKLHQILARRLSGTESTG
jgi:transcriptional regulator with XRE-family HTH domain